MHKACEPLSITVFLEITKAKHHLMPNLLVQLQTIDNRLTEIPLAPSQGFTPPEPRSERRAKARDAAKALKLTISAKN